MAKTIASSFRPLETRPPHFFEQLPDVALDRIAELSDARTRHALAKASPRAATHCDYYRAQNRDLGEALQRAGTADAVVQALTRYPGAARNLVYLDLRGRNLGADGALAVSRALPAHCPKLERLSLADNAIEHIASGWQLPATLRVLNLGGNPHLFAADAEIWEPPTELQGLNLQGVELPNAWASHVPKLRWPTGLQVFHAGTLRNAVTFKLPMALWHLTTDDGDAKVVGERLTKLIPNFREVVKVTENDRSVWRAHQPSPDAAAVALRGYTCGPEPLPVRQFLSGSTVVQAVAQGAAIYLTHSVLMQMYQDRRGAAGPVAVQRAVAYMYGAVGAHSRWGLLQTMQNMLDGTAAHAVSLARRAALGDVAGEMTPLRDLAVESLFFVGNTLFTASLAHINQATRALYIVAVTAPVSVPTVAMITGSILHMVDHDAMGGNGVAIAMASIAAGGATGAASAWLTHRFWPNYFVGALGAMSNTNAIRDWTLRKGRNGLGAVARWSLGA